MKLPLRYVERALAFIVASDDGYAGSVNVWPASCGAEPILRMHADRAKGCYSIRSIGPGGFISEEDRRCVGIPNGDG